MKLFSQNQRKRLWWLCVLALSAVGLLLWRIWPAPQPYYNGKPLAYWFNQLPEVWGGTSPTERSIHVVQRTGTNSYTEVYYNRRVGTNVVTRHHSPPDPECMRAMTAIRSMGTNAFPFLFNNITRQKSRTRELAALAATKCGMGNFFLSHFPSIRTKHGQATAGMLALIPLPPECVSQLQMMTNNQMSTAVAWVLEMNAEYQQENSELVSPFQKILK